MDTNGNQRKRTGRSAKSANNNESPSSTHESTETLEVSAVAISPTLEETETSSNAPVSECRRSSRKKIIKFDVRDLLNKNRKTHKIQIEARIDSNAPSTSKANTASSGNEAVNSKTCNAKDDLLSKQKTFLEKSAIFRRYSISQEHKPPPPPLPMPPLLGKANDNKDSGLSSSTSNRRLSRTQEFFSNVMIKPKQTTSLIVAQIESNTPTTSAAAKRRSLNKSLEYETKAAMSSHQESVTSVQQKKRGRPAKFKTPEAVSNEIETKKISPEKAKNWKEYKACLAQQTDSSDKVIKQQNEKPKDDIVFTTFEETTQSDILKSDDDGNFSGFQTNKDDTSCDSPVLDKFALAKDVDVKKITKIVEDKKLEEFATNEVVNILQADVMDSNQMILNETDQKAFEKEVAEEELTKQQEELIAVNKLEKKNETSFLKKVDETLKDEKNIGKTTELSQKHETEIEVDNQSANETIDLAKPEDDKSVPEIYDDVTEPPVTENKPEELPIHSKCIQLNKDDNKNVIPTNQNENEHEEIILECNILLEEDSSTSDAVETPSKSARISKTPDIVKANKLIDECSPETKLTSSDILLLTSQLTPSQPPTPSEETTKSSSRTSSSSESENTSTYSSDPASTSSSSTFSSRSYKSGDKLRVSLKRISLPKSPSTSSQTSTSEELNSGLNPEIVKKKPPMGKRSKRLQRKLLDKSKIIDDCFQKIEDTKNVEEILQSQNIKDESFKSKINTEAIQKSETTQNIERICTESLEKDSCIETSKTNITDAMSTNIKLDKDDIVKDTSTVVKRKSLRNRKEIVRDNTEIPTEKEIVSKDANEEVNIDEKLCESHIELESQISLENDLNEETKKIKNSQPIKQRLHRKFKKLISSEEEEKSNSEVKEEIILLSSDTSKDIQETNSNIQTTETIITEISSIDNNPPVKITDKEEQLSKTTTNKSKSKKEVETTDLPETVEKEQEICTTTISTRKKTNNELNTLEEPLEKETNKLSEKISNQEQKIGMSSTRRQTNKEDINPEVKSIAISSTRSKTIEEVSNPEETTDSQSTETKKNFRTKAGLKAEVESSESSPVRTKSHTASKLDNTPEYTTAESKSNDLESNMTLEHVPEPEGNDKSISEETKAYKSPDENITTTLKETDNNELGKNSVVTRNNTNEEEASKQKSKTIADNVTNQEVSKNLMETRTAVDDSQESTDKYATVTKESADGKSKVTVTRSKANKEPTEVMEIQIDKSTKTDLQIKTSEKNVGEAVVDTSEHNQSHNTTDYKNVEGIKSTVTRGKTNKDETNNISPISSKSKESIEITEMPKSKTSSETEVSSNSTKPNEKKKPETFKLLEIVETDVKQKSTSPKRSIKNVNQPMEISQTSEDEILSLKSPTLTTSAKKLDMPVEVIQTFQVKNLEDISQVNISKISPSSANKMDMSLEDSSISQDKNLDESHENNSNSKFSLVETNKSEISTKAVLLEAVSTDGVSKIPTETSQTSSEFNLSSKIQEILKDDVENDPTTSNKRKSLRNQMEKETIEEPITLVTQTAENADNPQQLEEIYTSTSEKAVKQQNDNTVKEDIIKPTKRRSRKSRFKNLHTPDIESETDSNNGNNTPIAEILQQQQREPDKHADIKENKAQEETQDKGEIATLEEDEIAKATEKTSKTQNTQDDKNITKIAKPNDNEPSKTNLSTSQIQNVSIETNTLLDILRTVQSNTEAALKASKTSTDIQNQETQNFVEIPEKACMEDSLTNTTQVSQATNIASPTRSETNSPLTLKRMLLSPTRSDSASPLTLKKVTQSPTRSDSSSPLTLKKITRRYERRSRRGEESVHKTLEETFAEIAAESSKAVLAAKEHDINEEVSTTTDENPPKETSNIDKEQQLTKALPKTEKSLVCAKDSVKTNVNTMENVTQTEIKSLENEIKNHEKAIETQESCKVTPVRRGRKPKQRPLESAENKEQSEEKLTCNELIDTNPKDNSLKLTELKDESKEMYSNPSTEIIELSQMENKHPQETKNDHKTTKTKKLKEMVPIDVVTEVESKSLANLPTISSNNEINKPSELTEVLIPTSSIIFDDKAENKAHKKPLKKRDSFKTEAVSVELNLDSTATKEKEDEVKTPKQLVKNRDTSQTKSGGKKTTKKTKNEEEDSFTITKDDTLTKSNSNLITTTPPPSKRGRKPKSQQETPQSTAISKKKNKKDQTTADNVESDSMLQERSNTLDSESEVSHLDKSFDEKLAKKKRQKKLKEAFEAALTEDVNKAKESEKTESSSNLGLTRINKSPTPPQIKANASNDDSLKITCVTPVEAEEEPDPLKDIEKFIADGVNLLKKDYKLDEDSVDDVLTPTPAKTTEVTTGESVKSSIEETEAQIFNTFETPADTPINTPSATPPPKSPTSIESSTPDENSGVRRSHRIKLITKTPKALVGRGLVRDKERFSIKDDVETKSHYTLDDHLTDLAEVEAKNAKFLKEMEERLSNFQVIKENEYLCERVISREARKMICDCFLTHEEEERGELGCGEDCLNRLLMIECGPDCNVKERCTNKRFQKLLCSPCRVFRTEKKGFGIMADIEILPGEFIMEYVGEVIDTDEFEKRRIAYSQDKNRHYYFMALRSDAIIDATIKGNISRFINHSCDPNAETQKWTVNGELRIGFFSRKSIMPGEEITFNYQYQRYGREAQRCYCESANCTGWIGQEPTSDEGEQIDDDDDESEDEEEADTSNLLVQDDDEDSDASVADPEEVQKQLEMAAAQAEVELAPIQLLEEKDKEQKLETHENKSELDVSKNESDEDSKSKFKKLLSKMAEKVAAKQKQTKREQKLQRKKKSKESSGDLANKMKFLEDPDIEDEVEFLRECGLKNQSDTLRLSRLMVRAKLVQTRLNLLEILRKGDLPCRRLFLDYHGLRLLHGWMSEDAGNMQIRLSLLQTLETLPIANKTVLTDSKVMQVVRNWCGNNTNLSPNDDSSSSNSNSQDVTVPSTTNSEESTELVDLQKLALKLITTWEGLPEIFRIPKKRKN